MSRNTGCCWISSFWLEHTCFSFVYTFCYNQLFPILINTVAIRGFRYHCQVLRAPPSLTTPVQHPGAAPTLPRVQDPISTFQSHQSLPQQHHSRASPQLCPSCPQGGAHAWARAAPCLARGGMSPAASFCSAGQSSVWIPHPVPQAAAVLRCSLALTCKWGIT